MNSKISSRTKPLALGSLLTSVIASSALQADDIEVYLQPPPDPVAPNVLFILDESGSMGATDGQPTSRMAQLRSAMTTLLDDPDMANVRAGIMGYTTHSGNNGRLRIRVISDFAELGDVGSPTRESMKAAVSTLTPRSYTPSVKALEFAADWFFDGFNLGANPVGWANNDDDGDNNHNDKGAWHSPVDLWCRPNHMVLLTDGYPNSNSPTSGQRYGLTSYRPADPLGSTNCPIYQSWQSARCAPEIASWAYNTDMRTDPSWPEQQNLVTHTIGFHTSGYAESFLIRIASNGGGHFYAGDSASDLVNAFTAIVQDAQTSVPYTYNAPTIPFNADNAATSGDEIYVPLFATDTKKFWKGNIKKYHIAYDVANDEIDITDANDADVLDTALNFLDRVDYWNSTGSSDDGDPLVGGAASNMDGNSVTRKLYTHLEGQPSNLTASQNRVVASNNLITAEMLDVDGANDPDAVRTALLNWINWRTDDGSSGRQGEMGAPLHTSPIIVRYTSGGDLVLINTTEGILHAFNADGTDQGEEVWAYMPDELLETIKDARDDAESTIPMYGLDGPMTYYEANGHKYVVFGMRRGGRNYYALDITDRTQPKFAWEIRAGVTSGFDELGQTWSKPILTRLEIEGNTAQDVLIFGGGYDDDQDTATSRQNDDLGNHVYIVNPTTGDLIRKISSADLIGNTGMNNAIAADILPVDINANGVTDRLYVADVGGRIIRIDIPDKAIEQITGSHEITGGVIADVGGADGFQRFFNTPEVAYYKRGGTTYLALMIASGHRPDPLSTTVTDRFYMIKDPNVWTAPPDNDSNGELDYIALTEDDLYDATSNQVQEGNDNDVNDTGSKLYAEKQLRDAKGWYIDFAPGEKGFSEAKVYDYAVLFTTYKGTRSANADPCLATSTQGEAQLYILDMTNGGAKFGTENNKFVQDSTDPLTADDRNVQLSIPGMPPSPDLIFPKTSNDPDANPFGGVVKGCVGLQCPAKWKDKFHPISWEEVIED
ncbi:pilus assembly protein [Thiolapillus sp.]